MIIRKLEPHEHARTRFLYEAVFPEDDQKFVDYYYKWKTKDNIIYVAEDGTGIHAMVHLNPFRVSVKGKICTLHYIVAVATEKEYRHQGLMRKLLAEAEQEMQEAGERLTFLMPASEKIYEPFGYRFFAWQRKGVLGISPRECGKEHRKAKQPVDNINEEILRAAALPEKPGNYICRPAEEKEYTALAEFVNRELESSFDLFVYRDGAYYERLCEEQKCQSGAVMVICGEQKSRKETERNISAGENRQREQETDTAESCQRGQETEIAGTFCTAWDEEQQSMVLREIILARAYWENALEALQGYVNQHGPCAVEGCQQELVLDEAKETPLLMGKVPGEGIFSGISKKGSVFINEVV